MKLPSAAAEVIFFYKNGDLICRSRLAAACRRPDPENDIILGAGAASGWMRRWEESRELIHCNGLRQFSSPPRPSRCRRGGRAAGGFAFALLHCLRLSRAAFSIARCKRKARYARWRRVLPLLPTHRSGNGGEMTQLPT